jgi:uncharacterized membrane protein YeaQ/YmgE (transglycosylase-associated protein family)
VKFVAGSDAERISVKNSLALKTRVLGALAGFFGGGVLGIIALVFAMVFARSDFGLNSIRPQALLCAIIGAIVGFCLPKKVLKILGNALGEL